MKFFRPIHFWKHLAAGLIAGLFIGIMCFTGTTLAFEEEITAWAERDARQIVVPDGPALPPRLTLAELHRKLRATQPEFRPVTVTLSNDPAAAVTFGIGREGKFYLNPATIVAGARLAQLPRHTFSLWNRCEINNRWGVGGGIIYRDELFASIDNTVRLPGFIRYDAAVFYRHSKMLRAQLNIENLFDRTYYSSAHNNTNITPGSPRAIRASLTTSF